MHVYWARCNNQGSFGRAKNFPILKWGVTVCGTSWWTPYQHPLFNVMSWGCPRLSNLSLGRLADDSRHRNFPVIELAMLM